MIHTRLPNHHLSHTPALTEAITARIRLKYTLLLWQQEVFKAAGFDPGDTVEWAGFGAKRLSTADHVEFVGGEACLYGVRHADPRHVVRFLGPVRKWRRRSDPSRPVSPSSEPLLLATAKAG